MSDIEKKLRDMGKEQANYPRDLKAATRAEYVTNVRMMKKEKKGCPLTVLPFFIAAILTIRLMMG